MEINRERVAKAIAVMQRVADRADNVDMATWQQPQFSEDADDSEDVPFCTTEEEMHACGTAACFGGWLAVSPEWKADGGLIDETGGPIMSNGEWEEFGTDAVALWLGLPTWKAECLTCTGLAEFADSHFYGKPVRAVTARDVVQKLKELL